MIEHERIWLQPWCSTCSMSEDRNWCQDDVWGGCEGDGCPQRSVEYVRADLVATPAEVAALRAERDAAVAENEELRLAIQSGEDAPGHASSIPLAVILDNARQLHADAAQGWDATTLRAEVERLREALTKIATPLDIRDVPHTKGNAITWRMEAARAALEDKP